MAFNKVCATIINDCTKIRIKDITGAYDAISNPNGWNSPSTIDTADVVSATVSYYIGDSTERNTQSVLSVLPTDPVLGNFTLLEEDINGYTDGFITIIYTLTTSTKTYNTTIKTFFTCNARCCIDKMWAKIAKNCDCNCDLEQMISDALMAEGLLKAVQSAASCASTDGVQKMLDKIKRLCNFNDCNCDD